MKVRAFLQKLKAVFFTMQRDRIISVFGGARPGSFLHRLNLNFSRAAVGPVPYVIKLDITSRCDLGCAMCYAGHGNENLSLEKASAFLSQFRGMGLRLDLMGGEPLMNEDLEAIISFAKRDAGFGDVIMYSNAARVTREKARTLKTAGLDRAIVNLNSHDERAQDAFTGVRGSWKKTTDGIRNFIGAGVRTYAFFVLHRGNIGDYDRMKAFADTIPGLKPLFYSYIPSRGPDAMIPERAAWRAVKRRVLYESGAAHRRLLSSINAFCGKSCLGGYYSFSVKINGNVTPCPFIDDVVIGNAFEENFWEVFSRRKDCESYRKFISVPEECGGCAYLDVCRGGCRAGSRDAQGFYTRKDFRCPGPWNEVFDSEEMFDRMPIFF